MSAQQLIQRIDDSDTYVRLGRFQLTKLEYKQEKRVKELDKQISNIRYSKYYDTDDVALQKKKEIKTITLTKRRELYAFSNQTNKITKKMARYENLKWYWEQKLNKISVDSSPQLLIIPESIDESTTLSNYVRFSNTSLFSSTFTSYTREFFQAQETYASKTKPRHCSISITSEDKETTESAEISPVSTNQRNY